MDKIQIRHLLCFLALGLLTAAETQKPLPDPSQLRARSRATLLQGEKDLEKYSCTVLSKQQELNDDKTVKREKSELKDRYFVNGIQLEHVLARDGRTLTGRDARKEQERANNDVRRFSDPKQAAGEIKRQENQEDLFLRALKLTNGHRETRDNRSIVVYDLVGDPNFKPKKIEEKLAQAVTGRIWLDEETGQPLEIRFQTDKDVKLVGGLANLHKGFQLHVIRQRQSDGVWMMKSVEGSGEARAMLFYHPRFRFMEEVSQCHLFNVDTQQKIEAPKAK
jgi:hypothetical protein